MSPPPRHKTSSFSPVGEIKDEITAPIVLGDIMTRLGKVEEHSNKSMLILGQLSEAINHNSVILGDIKLDIRALKDRQDCFEDGQKEEVQKALDLATKEKIDRKKEKVDRRNSALKYFVGALITLTLGAIAAHFGWK